MARAKQNKLYRTFVKGLITEAGYLTYPEDASTDELNTLLSRKGNRSRRLGLDYETDYAFTDVDATESVVINEYPWHSVNNDPTTSFMCIQVGKKLHFYKMNELPLSTQKMSFTVDLSSYKIPTAPMTDFTREYADFCSGTGFLFVAHKYMDPISIEYKPLTDTLVVVPIVVQIRDLEGVYDGLANDEEPKVLTAQHHYNLRNQGWVSPGSRTVSPNTPSNPGSSENPMPGNIYYDPYSGERTGYERSSGGVRFPDRLV